jgi:hypothetical protein
MKGIDFVLTGTNSRRCKYANRHHFAVSKSNLRITARQQAHAENADGTLTIYPCHCDTNAPITENFTIHKPIRVDTITPEFAAKFYDPNFSLPQRKNVMQQQPDTPSEPLFEPPPEPEIFVEIPHQRNSCKLLQREATVIHIITAETKLMLAPLDKVELLIHWYSVHTEPCPHPATAYSSEERRSFTTGPDYVTFPDIAG